MKIFGPGVEKSIGTVSNVVSLSMVGKDVFDDVKANYDDKEAYLEELYRMLDAMDGVTNLYDNSQEREELILDTLSVICDKNLDPIDVLKDLGELMSTGDFESAEETLMFDVTLRKFLHACGKSIDEVEKMMPEIIETMKTSSDVYEVFSNNGIKFEEEKEEESLEKFNIDGRAGISGLELQAIMFDSEKKAKIDTAFDESAFSDADKELIEQSKVALKERIIDIDYYGVLNEADYIDWNTLNRVSNHILGYTGKYIVVDGEPYVEALVEAGEDEAVYEQYDYETSQYKHFLEEELKRTNKTHESVEFHPKEFTDEEIEEYYARKREGEEKVYLEEIDSDSGLDEMNEAQYIEVEDSSYYEMLTNIDENVQMIYDAVGQEKDVENGIFGLQSSKIERAQFIKAQTFVMDKVFEEVKSYYENIITELLEIKSGILLDIVIDKEDLLIDRQSANNTQLLYHIIDLINDLPIQQHVTKPVVDYKKESTKNEDYLRQLTDRMRSTVQIMPSTVG